MSNYGSQIRFRSEAFLSGGAIPKRHAAVGSNISPSLRWDELSEDVAELALILESTPKSGGPSTTHWVMYKIPPEDTVIPEGIPPVVRLEEPLGAYHGKNSWDEVGYRGPVGNQSARYTFSLYALDSEISVSGQLSKDGLLKAMQKHIIGVATLDAVFEG
jgi:Raf kinase inhibitor-like YbhB/YbcL family protein